MRSFHWFAAALLTASLTFVPAQAQDGPVGIAFVEAPELSSGICVAGNPDKGFACAREKCAMTEGVSTGDCLRVKWCFPSGWSGDVFIQNRDGFHWHEYLCGWDARETLEAAAKVKCDATLRDYILDCALVQVYDPDGTQVMEE